MNYECVEVGQHTPAVGNCANWKFKITSTGGNEIMCIRASNMSPESMIVETEENCAKSVNNLSSRGLRRINIHKDNVKFTPIITQCEWSV